jgi:hypothetical protein
MVREIMDGRGSVETMLELWASSLRDVKYFDLTFRKGVVMGERVDL